MKSILPKVFVEIKNNFILGNVSLYVMLLRTEVRKNFHNLLMLLNTFEIVSKKIVNLYKTRWTFFRVKLVFEYDLEICWSLCPWDPWTFGLLDLFPPPLLPHTSSYLLLSLPPTLLLWYGLDWGKGGLSFYIGD